MTQSHFLKLHRTTCGLSILTNLVKMWRCFIRTVMYNICSSSRIHVLLSIVSSRIITLHSSDLIIPLSDMIATIKVAGLMKFYQYSYHIQPLARHKNVRYIRWANLWWIGYYITGKAVSCWIDLYAEIACAHWKYGRCQIKVCEA